MKKLRNTVEADASEPGKDPRLLVNILGSHSMASNQFLITEVENDLFGTPSDLVELRVRTTQGEFCLWIQTKDREDGTILIEPGPMVRVGEVK